MKLRHLPLVLLFSVFSASLTAQTQDLSPWQNTPYGNEWIDYGKQYVRVGIPADGVYKISFDLLDDYVPGISSTNFEIWHRGQKVTPLTVSGTEVAFWGMQNDGASDGLLFRPGPEDRLDLTTSFYSEEGSYFFTTGTPASLVTVNGSPVSGIAEETHHTETLIRNNSKLDEGGRRTHSGAEGSYRFIDFSFSIRDEVTQILNNSFFEKNNAFITLIGSPGNVKAGVTSPVPTEFKEKFTLSGFVSGTSTPVLLEYALHSNGDTDVAVPRPTPSGHLYVASVSNLEANLFSGDKILETQNLATYTSIKRTGVSLSLNTHFSSTGEGYIGFKSAYTETRKLDMFGFSYYSISYPQRLSLDDTNSKSFFFKNSVSGKRKIKIADVTAQSQVFDISTPHAPKQIINATLSGNELQFDVDRETGKELVIHVSQTDNGITPLTSANVHTVDFSLLRTLTAEQPYLEGKKPNPSAFDFLIITHDNPERDVLAGALDYADYRGSTAGGNHRTMVITTRNIYNQFNFGEPSPLAIRRFVDYMIRNGIRDKHHVLLIGHAVSLPTNVQIELPYEVPTMGDPGSDALLVSELSNSPYADPDIPAVPVGRINAFSSVDVINYLNKVKEYELQTLNGSASELAWRKKILQVVGAKQEFELTSFKNYFQQDSEPRMQHTPSFSWLTTTISNTEAATGHINTNASKTNAPIGPYISEGLGVLSYFGHGNQTSTIYDIRTATNYTNSPGRYPFLYITGCGVGNVFTASRTATLATTWITTANKGGIAMIANSYKAYVGTVRVYMPRLYARIFTKQDSERKTIGRIWVDMAIESLTGGTGARIAADNYTISNIHQSNIYGDPSISILDINTQTLPVELTSFTATLQEQQSVLIRWTTAQEKDNDFFEIERSFDGKSFETIGKIAAQSQETSPNHYSFTDKTPSEGINYYRLKQVDKSGHTTERESALSNIISVSLPYNRSLKVYPNPTSKTLTIEGNNFSGSRPWRLFNVSGNKVMEGRHLTINIDQLPAGIYVIELEDNNGSLTRRQIIKN